MLEVKARRIRTIIVLDLSGSIDIDSAVLIEKIGAVLNDGYMQILCDFSEVNLVDYSGLSALAIAYKNVVNHKAKMKFFSVPQHVMKVLSLVCLDKVFEIYLDEKKALKSFEDESSISEIQKKQLRRRFKRLPLDIDIQFKASYEEKFFHGKVLNISAVGMLVFADKIYKIGDILEIKIAIVPISQSLALTVKVVWLVQKKIQPQLYPGMGLEFYHIDCHVQEKVIEFVERNMAVDRDV
jgi:anti-anti-sigma factor